MPNVVPVSELSPPPLIATTHTSQLQTTMDVDDGLEDHSIASTNPFRMAIPNPSQTY